MDRARQRHGGQGNRRRAGIASTCRPTIPHTRCAASGSPRKRSAAITTGSPTKACGRSATSRTCGPCSAPATGSSTRTSTSASPRPSVAEAKTDDPIVLVQDYHFALLPRFIHERLPKATIITFWHIPWPNPESFGICPWRKEVLEGLLGSTILGFHTQYHCRNFIDTVDRYLEARIGYENSMGLARRAPDERSSRSRFRSSGRRRGPIGSRRWRSAVGVSIEREGFPADVRIGIGVDRMDYTKGIIERFHAVERLLELQPGIRRSIRIRADRRADPFGARRLPRLRGRRARARHAHQRPLRRGGRRCRSGSRRSITSPR